MSLISASGILGGIKEYTYGGIKQLPIVLGTTSFFYTVATGSMAHMNLFLGLGIISPLYTFLCQTLIGLIMSKLAPNSIFWKRVGSDSCNMVPSGKAEKLDYYLKTNSSGSVPSYWLMGVAFFIGYAISNAVDSLLTPVAAKANKINHEKRNSQAIFIIVATSIFSFIILATRMFYMSGCEGSGYGGYAISLVAAAGAASIGYGMYRLSKVCGARSSDLFGVLSQILPAAATSPHPVVCTAD